MYGTCRLLETRDVGIVAAHSNDRKLAAKSVQDGSLRLYLCVMLHRQPFVCDGGEAGVLLRMLCLLLRLYLCVMLHRQPIVCDGGEASLLLRLLLR